MSSILYAILAILILSILIVLHESGHYFMGKILGFDIVEFSIGMGPVLFHKKGRSTDFTIRAFLIGGACQFYGEDQPATDRKSFNSHAVWKRFLVVFAGPLMNILTALLLAFVILLGFGSSKTTDPSNIILVTAIEEGSPAENAGIVSGDIILSLNGVSCSSYEEFKSVFDGVRENQVDVGILRNATLGEEKAQKGNTTEYTVLIQGGESLTLHAEDIRDKRTGNNRLGVSLSIASRGYAYTRYNVFTAAAGAFPYCWSMTRQVYEALFDLLTGKACINQMSGVIGTVSIMSESMEAASEFGAADVIYVILALGALISINFAVINLLPFPALDGGRLIFIIIEMLRGKPVSPEKEGFVHFIGMMLLLALIAVLMVSDLMNCFRG